MRSCSSLPAPRSSVPPLASCHVPLRTMWERPVTGCLHWPEGQAVRALRCECAPDRMPRSGAMICVDGPEPWRVSSAAKRASARSMPRRTTRQSTRTSLLEPMGRARCCCTLSLPMMTCSARGSTRSLFVATSRSRSGWPSTVRAMIATLPRLASCMPVWCWMAPRPRRSSVSPSSPRSSSCAAWPSLSSTRCPNAASMLAC
mmetsp:Transcript_57525/g.157968  ORF Transcript_57525/g.157968 Transcript_57525/m.157968 type:complete len:202 (+) Transcript_57525:1169-1774(+)